MIQVGQEIRFRGARAVVYEVDSNPERPSMKVELLEDVPHTADDGLAKILLTDPRDPIAGGGQEGDLFMVPLPPKGYTDTDGYCWEVDWGDSR